MLKYLTNKPSQTKKLGEKLAKKFLGLQFPRFPKKPALVIGLEGDLGGGKTTFLQGFAKGLGIEKKILSPTFVLMKKFQIPKSKFPTNSKIQIPKFKHFYHIDCYRVKGPKELFSIGLKKIISNPQNIVAIEWADRIRKILPKDAIWVYFEFIDKDRRKIILELKKKIKDLEQKSKKKKDNHSIKL